MEGGRRDHSPSQTSAVHRIIVQTIAGLNIFSADESTGFCVAGLYDSVLDHWFSEMYRSDVCSEGNAMAGNKLPKAPVLGVVVSFPKAGRTWLRVMLDELGLPFDYRHDGSTHSAAYKFSQIRVCSKPLFHMYPVVFLSRDPRDTVVSGYFELTRRDELPYNGTISDFLRDPRHGIKKCILFNKTWLKVGSRLRRFLPITYEKLKAEPEAVLREIVDFVGAEVTDDAIARVVRENTFEKMRQREANGEYGRYKKKLTPRNKEDPESYKVRRGKIGGYVDYLSPEDLDYCDEMLERYGYWHPNSPLVEWIQGAQLSIQQVLRL